MPCIIEQPRCLGLTVSTSTLQATQAYLAGNKALAKELGAKGRAHAEQMQAAHAVAADAIYKQRNAHSNPPVAIFSLSDCRLHP